ncbi:MAG: hypothetical protein K0Q93_161 [Nocardioidaceae bacterium]|nr:hypothetical protein [Nocardioidaceae bacterium]
MTGTSKPRTRRWWSGRDYATITAGSDLLRLSAPRAGSLQTPDGGPVLLHALDGFLSAGQAGRLAADHLLGADATVGRPDEQVDGQVDDLPDDRAGGPVGGEVVAALDVDRLFDYRARRPPLAFDQDHYSAYEAPRLDVRRLVDAAGTPYLLLAGPEPDYGWEGFADAVRRIVETFGVRLVVGIGAVPMAVPHTRPIVVTAHATRPELVDRPNLWSGRLVVPASAQALLELRLGEWGQDAMGYVAHVPHYVSQVEFAPAAVTLLEAAGAAAGLTFDLDALAEAASVTLGEVDRQVVEQEGEEVLSALEQQYDAFSRGAGQSMLARDDELPSADELGQQFEQFLAGLDHREGRD